MSIMTSEKKGKAEQPCSGPVCAEIRSAPLWSASRLLLSELESDFFQRWKKVAKRFEEDDVHDLRVASRRLREGLALFSPCFPQKQTARLVKQIKKITRMLGDLRNTDEAFLFFASLTPEESGPCRTEVEQLLATLKRERVQAHKKLAKDFDSLDPGPLRKDLDAIEHHSNLFAHNAADPCMGITAFAGGAIMERAQPLSELLPQAVQEQNCDSQHRLRIAIKKLRYRLEIIEPLLTRDYEKLHGGLKGYQDVLGKLHDVDVFCDMVEQRLKDETGKEHLLRLIAEKRSDLFASFIKKCHSFPLESVGVKARDAL
jgi:CHAD domain-containing protein